MPPPVSSLLQQRLHLVIALVLIWIVIPQSFSTDLYTSCRNLFSCGTLKDVGFPLWGGSRPSGCGYPQLELSCEQNSTFIVIENVKYIVRAVFPQTQMLRIARQGYMHGICSTEFLNTTLDDQVLGWVSGYANFTFFYGCSAVLPYLTFNCSVNGLEQGGYFQLGAYGTPQGCSASVVVPVSEYTIFTSMDWERNVSRMETALRDGFKVALRVDSLACDECIQSKGICGYNFTTNKPSCYCSDGRYAGSSSTCTSIPSSVKRRDVSLGVGVAIGGAAVLGILLGCVLPWFLRRNNPNRAAAAPVVNINEVVPSHKSLASGSSLSLITSSDRSPKSDIENGITYRGVPVFSYNELAEATCNFDSSREIGDGGFGVVYFGELRDGRVVAVKRLHGCNMKRAEQFMNEIEILTRLQHQNLVKLYGCTSWRSRDLILVYEYIPNGTIADHLFGKRASPVLLPWQLRLNIAIETADALAYLHRSDVVHRDVKTNNILLDNNFHVKVADFGLSRLVPTDVSHVSTAPQGSPGYVDPEYYKTYRLTDKSDVYSFGVVLCELISSKPAVDTSRHRHDITLASMAVRKIQNHALGDFVDPWLGFEIDYGVRRMMTSVAELAFRCLQEEKDMRPMMEEVLEALKRIGNDQFRSLKAELSKEETRSLREYRSRKEHTAKAAAADVIDI